MKKNIFIIFYFVLFAFSAFAQDGGPGPGTGGTTNCDFGTANGNSISTKVYTCTGTGNKVQLPYPNPTDEDCSDCFFTWTTSGGTITTTNKTENSSIDIDFDSYCTYVVTGVGTCPGGTATVERTIVYGFDVYKTEVTDFKNPDLEEEKSQVNYCIGSSGNVKVEYEVDSESSPSYTGDYESEMEIIFPNSERSSRFITLVPAENSITLSIENDILDNNLPTTAPLEVAFKITNQRAGYPCSATEGLESSSIFIYPEAKVVESEEDDIDVTKPTCANNKRDAVVTLSNVNPVFENYVITLKVKYSDESTSNAYNIEGNVLDNNTIVLDSTTTFAQEDTMNTFPAPGTYEIAIEPTSFDNEEDQIPESSGNSTPCYSVVEFTILDPPCIESISTLPINNDRNAGEVNNVTIDGGIGTLTHTIDNQSLSNVVLSADNYTYKVEDSEGNTDTQSFTIMDNRFYTTIEVDEQTNCDGEDATLKAVRNFINPSFSDNTLTNIYDWGDNRTGEKLEEAIHGQPYSVTIQIDNQGAASASIDGEEVLNAPLSVTDEGTVARYCDQGANISLNIQGGSRNYTVSWDGPNGYTGAGEVINVTAFGEYTYTVTDNITANCEKEGTVTLINDIPTVTVDATSGIAATCSYENSYINLLISGGEQNVDGYDILIDGTDEGNYFGNGDSPFTVEKLQGSSFTVELVTKKGNPCTIDASGNSADPNSFQVPGNMNDFGLSFDPATQVYNPNCFDDAGHINFAISGGDDTNYSLQILEKENGCDKSDCSIYSDNDFEVVYEDLNATNFDPDNITISNINPDVSKTYVLKVSDGDCSFYEEFSFSYIPPQPNMELPVLGTGGIKLNGEYYIQCKDDEISISWPISSDSDISGTYTITKDGSELIRGEQYLVNTNEIVLIDANVIDATSTTYEIAQATDGDGCIFSDANRSFELQQVSDAFQIDSEYTRKDSLYADFENREYNLIHAESTSGKVLMRATGGMELPETESTNYNYFLYDDDSNTLLNSGLQLDSGDYYSFNGLQAGISYRIDFQDRLECFKSEFFELSAPDTIKIERTLNTSYAGGVNIACKNGTDTVKVKTSGGLYPHFVELKSGDSTYFSQEVVSALDSAIFPTVHAGNYYIQVTDKYDINHYPKEFRYETRFEDFDMLEPNEDVDFEYEMQEPTCFYSEDGQLTITPTGGIPFPNDEYIIMFYNQEGTTLLDSIKGTAATFINSAGDYKVEVYDANSYNYNASCSVKYSVLRIKNIPQLKTDTIYSDYPLCLGDSTGKIHVRPTGGRSAGNYGIELYDSTETRIDSVIFEGANEHTFESLFSGRYRVKIYDTVGCEFSREFILKERNDPLKIVTLNPLESTCSKTTDAAINVTTKGGDGMHSLSINQGQSWIQLDSGKNKYQFANLAGGQSYEIWLKDENYYPASYQSSCLIVDSVTIAKTDSIVLSADVNQVSCYGGNDGSIKVRPTYGDTTNLSIFRFEWFRNEVLLENENSDKLENLVRGNYTVNVTYDTISCSQKTLKIGISEPNQPFEIESIQAQSYNCETNDPLKVQINLAGGWITQKYKVQIDNLIPDSVQKDEFNSLPIYGNLDYGTHHVTVWDSKGCEISDSFTIEYQKPVIDIVEISNVSCHGEATGSIKVRGQYEIMDYYLVGNQLDTVKLQSQHRDSVQINSLSAGEYNLWTEKGDCISDTISIDISEPARLQIDPFIVTEATCGKNDGELDVSIEGGTPPYSITWLNSIDPNAVGMGDYRVTVEDSLGCSFTSEISMLEVSPIAIEVDSVKSSYCNANNGYAKISVSGAIPPYSIYWNGIEGELSQSDLSPGIYDIEVLDALGCGQAVGIEITEPLPVKANVVDYREADCDIANGYIQFEYENLKAPFTINWPQALSPLNDYAANGLAAGEMYTLQIIDSAGCSYEFSFNIPDQSDLALDFEIARPSCKNNNGALKAMVTGGSGDYSYSWSTGEGNTDSISNLPAGFYYLTVEDALGCKLTDSVTLIDDPAVFPDYELIISNPTCQRNDGFAEVQFLEQDHNFEVYWPKSSTVSNRIESLAAGTYEAEIRNEDGCIKVVSAQLSAFQKPTLETESIKMPGCGNANGEIQLAESSTLSYVWSKESIGDTGRALNLVAGNYWVYGETESQCKTDTLFFTLDNLDSDIIIQTQSIISNSCPTSEDGSIQINVSGGLSPYSYLWNDDQEQTQAEAVNLKAGNYTVLVTDANDCSTSKTFNLQSENPVFIASFEQIEPQCANSNDGSLKVNVGGGKGNYTYEWSNGDTTPTADSLAIGTHSVKVFDGTSCFAFEEVNLSGPAPIAIALDVDRPICRGEATGYANLNISGGSGEYAILWEDGNTQASRSDLATGSHLLSIQDENGCSKEFEIFIPENDGIEVEYRVIEPSCFGGADGSIEVNEIFNAKNPYVEWEDGTIGFVRENLTAGLYVYTITDNSNCGIQDTIVVGQPDALEIVNANIVNPLCFGQSNGSISFEVVGGTGNYQYFWQDGFVNKNRTNLKDGSYQLTVQDDNGCSLIQDFVLNQPDTISITYEVSPVSCFGNTDGAIDLEISGGVGGYTVNWNDGLETVDRENLLRGTYFVSVSDSNGCEASQRIVVPEPSPLDIEVLKQQPSCNGGSDGQLTVTIIGGNEPYEITWEDGSTANTSDSLKAGTYSIEIIDAKGCEFSTSISLSQPSLVRVSEENTENPICYQEPSGYAEIIPTGGVGNYGIEWQDGDNLFVRNDLMAGVHTYTIFDQNGCTYDDQITLEDPAEITIEGLPKEVYICGSGTLILDGGDKWTEFNWTSNNGFSEETQEVEISQAGSYTLSTVNADGCTDEYSFEVYKDDTLIDTDFLLTSDAIVGDTVIIVDVSWPVPDSTFWNNNDNPDLYVVSQNENYQEVIFTKAGDYEIGMTAHLSLCQDDIRKTIKVMSPEVAEMQRQLHDQLGTSMNLEISVFPNPNFGKFRIESELNQKQDIEIHIFDLNKGRVVTSISGKESKNYVFDIDNHKLPAGVYLVMAQSGGKKSSKKFIVK